MDGGPALDRGEISCKVIFADSGERLRSVKRVVSRGSWKEQAVENDVFSAVIPKNKKKTKLTAS